MTDIANNEYVTINKQGIFVGGKPTEIYRDIEIQSPGYTMTLFHRIQPLCPTIQEIHISSSKTPGEFAKPGNPSPVSGEHAWCRAKFTDNKLGNWIFCATLISPEICAYICTVACMRNLRSNETFRSAVINQQKVH